MKKLLLIVAVACATLFTQSATAAKLGDAAPKIKAAKWVQGGPVEIKAGQITVVEFWATWCPPCRVTIPHLNEVYKKYTDKNVAFVGVSDETEEKVSAFVKQMGDKMTYPVAIGSDATQAGYMDAFGARSIPYAFIVGADGKFAWKGHPMDDLEAAIDAAIVKRGPLAAEAIAKPAEEPVKPVEEPVTPVESAESAN